MSPELESFLEQLLVGREKSDLLINVGGCYPVELIDVFTGWQYGINRILLVRTPSPVHRVLERADAFGIRLWIMYLKSHFLKGREEPRLMNWILYFFKRFECWSKEAKRENLIHVRFAWYDVRLGDPWLLVSVLPSFVGPGTCSCAFESSWPCIPLRHILNHRGEEKNV